MPDFECNRCHRSFNRKYNLERHEKKKKKCKKNEQIIPQKNAPDRKKTHLDCKKTQNNAFECNHCNRNFKRNWDLNRHLKT